MDRCSRKSFVRQILSLFILFHIVSILIFSLFVFQENRSTASQSIDDSLMEIVKEKAQLVSLTMQQIGAEAENLALWTEHYLELAEDTPLSGDYYFSPEGVLTREAPQDGEAYSSVFYPNLLPFDSETASVTMATEALDAHFRRVHQNIPLVSWIALPMDSGFLRVFPYADMQKYYAPDHLQKNDPFYQAALQSNRSNAPLWSDPYLDLMGTGWVITCIYPVVQDDVIVGFITLDVNLETLQREFLSDFRLGASGIAYLLQKDGAIISHPDVQPTAEQRGEMFVTSILQADSLSPAYKAAMAGILENQQHEGIVKYSAGPDRKIIAYSYIEELSWIMFIEVSQSEFIAMYPFSAGAIGMLILCSVLITVFFAFFFLRYYSSPMQHLVRRAEKISAGDFSPDPTAFHHQEMQQLSHAFNFMSTSINHRTSELLRKHKEIETMLNSIGGLLMIVDTQRTVLAINAAGARWFQSTPSALSGQRLEDLRIDSAPFFEDLPFSELTGSLTPRPATLTVSNRLYEFTCYPVSENGADADEIILYGQDITERVCIERELADKEKLANIGQLSASIAHELKTPFATIKGSLYLLDSYTKGLDMPKLHGQLDLISSTLLEAEKIITNLLSFARSSQLEISQVDIPSLIEQIVFIARKESDRMHVCIHTQVPQEPLYYTGMAGPIRQVLLNLVTNALHALPQGGNLYLSARIIQREHGSFLEMRVEDDGVGISPERLEHIFEPFVTYSNDRHSTGLGLWITKRFVEKMKGEIQISSQKDVGTSVIVTLPIESS